MFHGELHSCIIFLMILEFLLEDANSYSRYFVRFSGFEPETFFLYDFRKKVLSPKYMHCTESVSVNA